MQQGCESRPSARRLRENLQNGTISMLELVQQSLFLAMVVQDGAIGSAQHQKVDAECHACDVTSRAHSWNLKCGLAFFSARVSYGMHCHPPCNDTIFNGNHVFAVQSLAQSCSRSRSGKDWRFGTLADHGLHNEARYSTNWCLSHVPGAGLISVCHLACKTGYIVSTSFSGGPASPVVSKMHVYCPMSFESTDK